MWFWCGMPDPYTAWFNWSDRSYPGHEANCIECRKIDSSLEELEAAGITSITEGKMKFGDIRFAIEDTREKLSMHFHILTDQASLE